MHADDRVDHREHRREVVLDLGLRALAVRALTVEPRRNAARLGVVVGRAALTDDVVAVEIARDDAEAGTTAVADRDVLVDHRVVQERELEGEPAELGPARCVRGIEQVVGLGARGDVVALVDPHALGGGEVLELEAELELDGAAAADQIEADADVARPARGAIDEQLDDALRDVDTADAQRDAVLDGLLRVGDAGGGGRRIGGGGGGLGPVIERGAGPRGGRDGRRDDSPQAKL
ncbi:MAG: hypothetical protein IPQ07_32040 [Myxococcales bacterium]|nr:hypothetical protein [Myxococcales bacterium]